MQGHDVKKFSGHGEKEFHAFEATQYLKGFAQALQPQSLRRSDHCTVSGSLDNLQKEGHLSQHPGEELRWIRDSCRESPVYKASGWNEKGLYFFNSKKWWKIVTCQDSLIPHLLLQIRCEWINATTKRNLRGISCHEELPGRKLEAPLCVSGISNIQKWMAAKWLEYLEKM